MSDDKNNKNNKNNKNQKRINPVIIVIYFIIASIMVLSIFLINNNSNQSELTYDQFLQMINEERVASMQVENTGSINLTTKDGSEFELYAPRILQEREFLYGLANKGINIKFVEGIGSSWWVNLLTYLLPIAFFIFLWIMILRPRNSGNRGIGVSKSPAKKYDVNRPKVTFNDVAGIQEAKEELIDIVKFLKNPDSFSKIGARMPKGLLLVGEPGTGKTLLARAVAGEAGVPFYFISGSDFVEMFVGVGASRVRELFKEAKKEKSAIIFIDEIDAVGRARGAGLGGGNDEREQTLNSLLVEMDGFEVNSGIVVMAATNRPDILDRALLRPGRFDKKIIIDRPDLEGREEILKIHMKGKKIEPNVDVHTLALRTPGFVGADLENLINEAALLAAGNGRKTIKMEDCEEAIERVIAGPERKSRIISENERRIIAFHELGHAIVGHLLPNADPVHKVTIVPRGHSALGYTLQIPEEDKFLTSKSEFYDRITTMLAGRASEELFFNEITSGAGNDLKRATKLAKVMILQLGMSKKIGPIAWGEEEGEVFLGKDLAKTKNYSEDTADEVDSEIRKIINDCYKIAKEKLEENKEKVEYIADILLKKETISGDDLEELMEKEAYQIKYIYETKYKV
ncbi:ATP-dependent zinc metalloprotease FtsH [Geotoga petraea]|nr:ATP-dependent zinc metalloprotease FtsH [Geotoga petraea]